MLALTIAGNVGKDAETRTLQSGDMTVTSFTVAVEDRSGKEKQTLWFDVSLWGKRGAGLQQYIRKGGKVTVSGSLGRREYEGKTYLTLRADNVTLQGGGQSENGGGSGGGNQGGGYDQSSGGGYGGGSGVNTGAGDLDDSIPFAPCVR